MTPALLSRIGTALYGERFQPQLAAAVGVDLRAVQRWVAGSEAVPVGVWDELEDMLVRRVRLIQDVRIDLAIAADRGTRNAPLKSPTYTWIGDDCPPEWERVGQIDVADPADTFTAHERGLRIGSIYDGGTSSVAEPCAADTYQEREEQLTTTVKLACGHVADGKTRLESK